MGDRTGIEWADATWNPVTGCTRVSAGCDLCYAERFAERFRGVAGHPYERGFDLVLRPERLTQPLRWQRPRRIFVNSMSDLWHKRIPRDFVDQVFGVMDQADHHVYQVLTKRSSRMRTYINRLRYPGGCAPPHVWLGVSIESAGHLARLRHLRETRAAVRFLSLEPLLGPLGEIDLAGIHWVIVGGESGPGARPMDPDWARELRDQAVEQGVPFHFKQWGGLRAKDGGRELDGRTWDEYPDRPSGS